MQQKVRLQAQLLEPLQAMQVKVQPLALLQEVWPAEEPENRHRVSKTSRHRLTLPLQNRQ